MIVKYKSKLLTGSLLVVFLAGFFLNMNIAMAQPGSVIPLKPTTTFKVPAGLTSQEVLTSIKIGLVENQWKFNKGTSKSLEASLKRRSHWLKLKFTFDTNSVRIDYADSKNLNYGPYQEDSEYPLYDIGTIVIHQSYERWVKEVKESTTTEFMRVLVRKELI